MADLTDIPATITAGDSYAITLTLPDYPATAGWIVRLALAGASVATWDSTAVGASHLLTLSTASTATLAAGSYVRSLRATLAGDVQTFGHGHVTVAKSLSTATAGSETTWAETTLAIVEAALANTLTSEMASYMIGGRRVDAIPVQELLSTRSKLRAEVAAARGGSFGVPIRMDVVGMR